jgi:hypothetical protein
MDRKLQVVLLVPEEAELPLLAKLSARDDTEIVAVVDPGTGSVGAVLAEMMGLRTVPDLAVAGELDGVVCVVPEQPSAAANDLVVAAERLGLATQESGVLLQRLRLNRPDQHLVGPPVVELQDVEQEADRIESSLAALEDALAADAILQRVLELATRAVGASSGSLMLLDEPAGELYIAYATGLSEATVQRTRVRLGQGIAGRVAQERRPELIEGRQGEAPRRDRPDIASAISAPLVWDGRLLGVVNVSTAKGQRQLGESECDLLADFAGRLGRILDRVLSLQESRTALIVSLTEARMRHLRGEVTDLPDLLASWAGALVVAAAAEQVTLVVPCHDGATLLVGEATADGKGRHRHEPHDDSAWIEVLGGVAPVVVRQEKGEGTSSLTVFFLPVGRRPIVAGLKVQFQHGSTSHAFHALASELAALLDLLLSDELERYVSARHGARVTDLIHRFTVLSAADLTPGERAERICAEAARLTGAIEAIAVASLDDGQVQLAGDNALDDADCLANVAQWLEDAAADGWLITTVAADQGASVSVLVVCANPQQPVPALVLVGKELRDPLDGTVFGNEDLEVVRPLARLLSTLPSPAPLAMKP